MTNDATLVDASLFPRLIVRARGRVVDELDLKVDLTIGRAEENGLQLNDPKVSRHHARVERAGATFVITDLDSANGTRVDGSRLTEPHTLQHGERISIGDTEITYQEPGRSTRDTVTSIGLPPAVKSAQAVPPPASVDVRGRPAETGRSRGLIIGLVVAAAVLLLAIAAVVAYLVAPSVFEQVGLVSPQPSATTEVAASPTPEEAGETPIVSAATPVIIEQTPATGAFDPQIMNDSLTQAEALVRQGEFEEAITIYEDLTVQAPDDARPYVGWAWALILDDEAEQALAYAQKAVELDPSSGAGAAVLARSYLDTGDKTEALDLAQQAVQLDAGSAQANAVLAEAYLASGLTQNAVDAADLALVQDANNADAHRVRGWLYHVTENDMGRAASELQIAAGLQPDQWSRRHELGVLLYEAEDYTTAILAFQDALGIRPKTITYAAIGKAYYAMGQYDQAKASFQQALSAGAEGAHDYGWLALILAQQGNCEDAQDYSAQALALDDEQPQAMEAEEICEDEGAEATPSATTGTAAGSTPGATPGATPGTTPGTTPEATAQATKAPAPSGSVSGRIAFPAWDAQQGKYHTYIAQAKDGGERRLLIEGMHQPAFRPDGTWLAVNGEQPERMNLFILREDGSSIKKVADFIEDGLPAWSPNGQGLVFSSTRHGDKQSRVYIIDEVPFDRGRVSDRALNFGPDDVRGAYPTWAPGDLIVYQGCDLTVEPGECGLYSIPSFPGPQPATRLTEYADDTAPAASGDRVAFMSNRDGNWEVYIMNIDGSGDKAADKRFGPRWPADLVPGRQDHRLCHQTGAGRGPSGL